MSNPRPIHLRRSWLFLPGAEQETLRSAAATGADVLIQELEDFTPPERRAEARGLTATILAEWRNQGAITAVRINPLEDCGLEDLEAIMPAGPQVVALPKVAEPEQVAALDREVTRLEQEHGIPAGTTEILPNIELARGLVQVGRIAAASRRVGALLLASEDLVADLGAERGRDGQELAYARQRFLVECAAASVLAVDCPYTFDDEAGCESETRWARRLGYRAKSAVKPSHAEVINRILTPSDEEVDRAKRIVAAFEAARREGRDRVELNGALVEMPTYTSAQRLLKRARELGVA